MEILVIGGLLFLLYQSGTFASLGFIPGSSLTQAPAQAISNTITAEEQQAFSSSGNQGNAPSTAAGIASGALGGISSGFSASAQLGPLAGAALGAAQGLSSAITSIFNGMAARAAQARLENQALNYAIQAFDRTISQVNAAYNNGSVSPQEAIALVQQIYQQFWGVSATKIQPNRNGCQSGANCPPAVDPEGYIACGPAQGGSITIGATCCIGCGPIKTGVAATVQAIQQGGGSVTYPTITGDSYGLQTRLSYQLTWGHA